MTATSSPAADRAKAVLAKGVARYMFADCRGTPGRHPFDQEVADALLSDLAAASLHVVPAEAGTEVAREHEAYRYLERLFKAVAPQCSPLPTLIGLCTQIDNYIAGLHEAHDKD